jgi:HTH-type transcriptional repressor of NAD biosynthesis genes
MIEQGSHYEQIEDKKEKIIGKTGVIVGKFYPPHRGHKYLINTASSQVNHLTVIVADKRGQTIPGELRAQWLHEIHPDVTVMVIDDVYPESNSKIWAENTIRWLGSAPDVVFTSEDYGHTYAKELGAKHVQVDKERVHVPICATKIRENPIKYLDFLEPCVREYYKKGVIYEKDMHSRS